MNHDVIGSSVKKFHWRYGILASLAITFLSIFPQIDLWRLPESARPGPYATLEFDEVAYSAYLNALISGRSRRNDPYLDLIDTPASPQPETLFSVQFLPPYMLALPARLLRLSAATIFILLGPLAAFASGIALFWLLGSITQDDRAAAAGLLLVLCFGSLVGTPLALRMIARFQNPFPVLSFLPFLRRYVPAVPFPFYLLFCGLIWRALTKQTVRAAAWPAIGAGLVFAVLVYSYFYYWTAAGAWLFCVAVIWLLARGGQRKKTTAALAIVGVMAITALVPYVVLLSHRAQNTDSMVVLKSIRTPDLFRLTELLGAAILLTMIAAALKGIVAWRDEIWLFAASFALLPFVVFNQQVITGLSLQPGHYQKLIANYSVLIAFVLAAIIVWHRLRPLCGTFPRCALIAVSLLALGWCLAETATQTARNRSINSMRVEEWRVANRLSDLARTAATPESDPQFVLFAAPLLRVHADSLPTDAPQPPFWAPHEFVFTASWEEYKERLYQNFYYVGIDEQKLRKLIDDKDGLFRFVFLAQQAGPITSATIPHEIEKYMSYVRSFDQERAAQTRLAFLVTRVTDDVDLSNLDRWYERDAGERIGDLMLYRLRLRGGGK